MWWSLSGCLRWRGWWVPWRDWSGEVTVHWERWQRSCDRGKPRECEGVEPGKCPAGYPRLRSLTAPCPSCRPAAHCNLTGRRVVDEALLRDTPPDSSLRPTVGPDLLRGSSPGNGQPRHSIGTVPSSSDDLSPPGRAELYPPAWVRQPTSDRSYRRCRGTDISVLTCVDREDRVAEAVHPRVRPDPQVRPTREVTPPHRSPVGYGQPAHAGTCPTAPSRSTHTLAFLVKKNGTKTAVLSRVAKLRSVVALLHGWTKWSQHRDCTPQRLRNETVTNHFNLGIESRWCLNHFRDL